MIDHQPFQWSSTSRSDVGNVRKINEDACLAEPRKGIWAVADGMGGHHAGDYAASQTISTLLAQSDYHCNFDDVIAETEKNLQLVNSQLSRVAAHRGNNKIIGSTVVVLLTYEDSCAFLWAGDSRLYLLRSGQLRQITKDHSHVQELVEAGLIMPEDAEHHPASNVITRAVGASESLELDSGRIALQNRDTFLLCSDGLYKDVSETEIADILSNYDEDRTCDTLVDLALSRACRDNVTAVVVNIHSAENPLAEIDPDQTIQFTNHPMG